MKLESAHVTCPDCHLAVFERWLAKCPKCGAAIEWPKKEEPKPEPAKVAPTPPKPEPRPTATVPKKK